MNSQKVLGAVIEEGSDEAISRNQLLAPGDGFAPLAMTTFCETINIEQGIRDQNPECSLSFYIPCSIFAIRL
jgi:hypothetical protein